MKKRALTVASLALATMLSAPSAHAQDKAEDEAAAQEGELSYKEYANQGAEAFAAKDYARAAEAFERAYELKPAPNLLYNIGRAREKLGEFEKANAVYTKFVTQPDVELKARQDALQRIKTLQEVIALQKSGESVDAAEVDKEQGEHQLAEAGLAEGDSEGETVGGAPVVGPGESAESGSTTAYVLMGSGAAALIGSGVFGYLTYAQSGTADDAGTLDARRDAAATGRTYGYVADGLLAGGIILAGLGTYLWLSEPDASASAGSASNDTSPQTRVTPSIGATGAALNFTVDF